MTIHVLVEGGAAVAAPQHALLGTKSETNGYKHVAILLKATTIALATPVGVHHMCPPLRLEDTMPTDVVAWTPLSAEEGSDIDDWIEVLKSEAVTSTYYLVPAAKTIRDDVTGRVIRRTFSCAGFVAEAYQAARISLVVPENQLPPVDRGTLVGVWGERNVRLGELRYGRVRLFCRWDEDRENRGLMAT